MTRRLIVLILILSLAGLVTACRRESPPVDPDYLAEVQAWQTTRLEKLTAADGWLTLVGLEWLEEGSNRMGADADGEIVLEGPNIGPHIADLVLIEGRVTLEPAAEGVISIDGVPITGPRPLLSDADEGGPDFLEIGRLMAYLISRGDRMALRIKDPQAATRVEFEGLEHFPIGSGFRVTATLVAYSEVKKVAIPTAVGTEDYMFSPGLLRFSLKGREHNLQPWISNPGDRNLFIVFTDATSGEATYGAGRFLSAELADDGTTLLDFNRAYTPPCGFTAFATCPLAPPENHLDLAVEAGERLTH